jgi:hypothetical protein
MLSKRVGTASRNVGWSIIAAHVRYVRGAIRSTTFCRRISGGRRASSRAILQFSESIRASEPRESKREKARERASLSKRWISFTSSCRPRRSPCDNATEAEGDEPGAFRRRLATTSSISLARTAGAEEDVDFEDDEAVAARACDRERTVSCCVNQRKGGRRAERRARNV